MIDHLTYFFDKTSAGVEFLRMAAPHPVDSADDGGGGLMTVVRHFIFNLINKCPSLLGPGADGLSWPVFVFSVRVSGPRVKRALGRWCSAIRPISERE